MRVLPRAVLVLLAFPGIAFAQQNVHFQGTEVTALGAATVSVASSKLFVGNIGSSGQDGFHLNTGGGQGVYLAWSQPFPASFAMQLDLNISPILEPCIIINPEAANTIIRPDYSTLGATGYRAEIWNDGEFVTATTLTPAQSLFSTPAVMAIEADLNGVPFPLPDPFPLPAPAPFRPSLLFRLELAGAGVISGPGGPLGVGDEIRTFPQNASGGSGNAEIAGQDFFASSSGPSGLMEFIDLAQLSFGRRHRSESGSLLHELGHVVQSLDPGVPNTLRVDVHPTETSVNFVRPPGFGAAGDTDEISITGELIAGGDAVIGRLVSSCNGSAWSLMPDFSGSLSPDAHVKLFNAAGALVAESPNVVSPITVASNLVPTGTCSDDATPPGELGIYCTYAAPVSVTLPGAGTFTAQRIVMLSNAPKQHKFFALIDRTQVSMAGVDYIVRGEENGVHFTGPLVTATGPAPASHNRGTDAWTTIGGANLQPTASGLIVSNVDASIPKQVDFRPESPADGFAIEWAPLGPPSATTGETDWAFLSKHAADPAPLPRMKLHLDSNGSAVLVTADPGVSPTNAFHVICRNQAGAVVAQFTHYPPFSHFAEAGDWPIAAGYTRLAYPDQPWSMFLHFGYNCPIELLTGGQLNAASIPVLASHIEVRAVTTANPGPPQLELLSAGLTDIPFMLFLDEPPVITAVRDTPAPRSLALRPPFPNPFNPATTLTFDLPVGGEVTLEIFTVRGERVAVLQRGWMAAGSHTRRWSGLDQRGAPVASGVYFATLRTPAGTRQAKLNLLK